MKPEDFRKLIREAITKVASRETMTQVGEEMINRIVKRTRLGYGVEKPGDARFPLPALDPKYIKTRQGDEAKGTRKLSKSGKPLKSQRHISLSSKTSPSKSNLTFTGTMLDSMKIKSITKNKVTVGPSDEKHNQDKISNSDLAEHHAENGRPFNTLSNNEISGITSFIEDIIRRVLKL